LHVQSRIKKTVLCVAVKKKKKNRKIEKIQIFLNNFYHQE
jgi:hypothetical protein